MDWRICGATHPSSNRGAPALPRRWSEFLLRRCLDGHFVRLLDHVFEQALKVAQPGGRNDDGVAPSVDVLGDAQEAPAGIFLQREDEGLALNLDLVRFERVLREIGRAS